MTSRVAVVVVHGVADQAAGDTARSVVDLLIATRPGGARYTMEGTAELALPVPPLQPHAEMVLQSKAASVPTGAMDKLKASCRSDLARSASRDGPPAADAATDPGITLTSALLRRHADAATERETPSDVYRSSMFQVRRKPEKSSSEAGLDVFEMYWADLSRLSGSVPRIVSEVFTLIFRLARLGRETVAEAYAVFAREKGARGFGWKWVQRLQVGLDWVFVHFVAMLIFQLMLLAAMLLGLGAMRELGPGQVLVAACIAGAAAIGFAYWLAYKGALMSWGRRFAVAGVAIAAALAFLWRQQTHAWIIFVTLVVLASVLHALVLRFAARRFNFLPAVPTAMWSLVLVAVALSIGSQWRADPQALEGSALAGFIRGVVFAVELLLWGMKWLWVGFGIALGLWFVAGWLARGGGGYEAAASVSTGRLGLGAALAGFLMLTMVLWAALSQGLYEAGAESTSYMPCLFAVEPELPDKSTVEPVPASPASQAACVFASQAQRAAGQEVPVSHYLKSRYFNSTAAFALAAVVVIALLAYAVGMLLPSVLAENKLLRGPRRTSPQAKRLGQWLSKGFRNADAWVTLSLGVGVVLSLVIAAIFFKAGLLTSLASLLHDLGLSATADASQAWEGLSDLSQRWLKPFVFSAASIGATLILFGGFLSKHLPAIRGPLDIALDVDNHFRTFPRDGVPRARIFSRYAALLREIARRHRDRPYDRIVIVAHSQGSVISAELLRYLCSDGKQADKYDAPRLQGDDGQGPMKLPPIHVATFGCPLRQLYAARFPTLYRWVLRTRAGVSGPVASDLGVARWANAFCAGDYVGRWLWSKEPGGRAEDHAEEAARVIGDPLLDAPADPLLGRVNAYAAFEPWPPTDQTLAAAVQFEMCLGLGAHTHYFDQDQADAAWIIDHMIGTPWPAAAKEP
jgi:hypothetical protein